MEETVIELSVAVILLMMAECDDNKTRLGFLERSFSLYDNKTG